MNRFVVLTPSDAANGFACAGASQHAVLPGETTATLRQALQEAGSGVVILDERLVAEVGEERLQELEESWPGVLVILPAPGGAGVGEDYATRLIRRAIGYQVQVRR
jgi:vacuolar-type H+-ATPase subunit F/Vma7